MLHRKLDIYDKGLTAEQPDGDHRGYRTDVYRMATAETSQMADYSCVSCGGRRTALMINVVKGQSFMHFVFFFRCSVVLEAVSCFHTEHLIHFWASCTVLLCRGGYRSDHYASLSARGQKEAAQDTTDKHRDIFSYGQLRCVTRRLHIVTARKYPHIFPKDSNCVNGQRVANLSACYLGRWYINYRDYLGAYRK